VDVKRSRGDGCERKNGAQRSFFVNVIARSDDRATTTNDIDRANHRHPPIIDAKPIYYLLYIPAAFRYCATALLYA
jgi:hypothetical protein